MPLRQGADHWRKRAKEAKGLADQMTNEDARWRMLRIASDYEKLARDAIATAIVDRIKDSLVN